MCQFFTNGSQMMGIANPNSPPMTVAMLKSASMGETHRSMNSQATSRQVPGSFTSRTASSNRPLKPGSAGGSGRYGDSTRIPDH